jgi:dihydroorotate dehydrogenase
MSWRKYIKDIDKLTCRLVDEYGLNRLAKYLSRDKQTINRWRSGNDEPSKAQDVGHLIRLALNKGIDVSELQTFNPIYTSHTEPDAPMETGVPSPPDLSWLFEVKPPPPARINFFGLRLDSPLGVASSPLTSNESWVRLILSLGYGLSTFRTRRAGKIQPYHSPNILYVAEMPDLSEYDPDKPPKVVVAFHRSESPDRIPNIVNSYGVPSEAVPQWQETYRAIRQLKGGNQIGVSIVGDGTSASDIVDDFQRAVISAMQLNPPFVELNLSCPNPEDEQNISFRPDLARSICMMARKLLEGSTVRLFVKLPYLADNAMRALLESIGEHIDAVVFQNTIKLRAIAVEPRTGKEFVPFGGRNYAGLSGPATYRMTCDGVRRLKDLREKLGQNFKIVAVGGIASVRDIDELLGVGADLVQSCTAAMFDPLLPWKIRYHRSRLASMSRQEVNLTDVDRVPQDDWERTAFSNACNAIRELSGRGVYVDAVTFLNLWDEYISQQSRPRNLGKGVAFRRKAPRSSADWVRVFTDPD